jgi:hypothetical protein
MRTLQHRLGDRARPRAQSDAPRARYGKLHRPSADFFLLTPRGAGLCARGRARSPGLGDCIKDSLWQKSGSYQISKCFLR